MSPGLDTKKPAVMCFSGLDPTGGAGIQADIETLLGVGCHCTPVITALTTQNTQNVLGMTVTEPTLLIQQARAILEDIPVRCFKLGLMGSVATIEVIHTLLQDYDDIPVVLDPVLTAGGGYELADEEVMAALRDLLIPLTTVLTPNLTECRRLAPTADMPDACASELLDLGCENILVTGTEARTPDVVNHFYSSHRQVTPYTWPRLEHVYHGSGCTLAAAIAGYLAHGVSIQEAVQEAQRFTWDALRNGQRMGFGQHLPDRSFWRHQAGKQRA